MITWASFAILLEDHTASVIKLIIRTNKEHDWLLSHLEIESKYDGEYIAIAEDAVLAHGKDFKKVLDEAEKTVKECFIHKVPPLDRELVV